MSDSIMSSSPSIPQNVMLTSNDKNIRMPDKSSHPTHDVDKGIKLKCYYKLIRNMK